MRILEGGESPPLLVMPEATWVHDSITWSAAHPVFTVYLVTVGFIVWLSPKFASRALRSWKLPPGPRGFPLIGDIGHLSDSKWLASPQRRDDYGASILTMFIREAYSCTGQVKLCI